MTRKNYFRILLPWHRDFPSVPDVLVVFKAMLECCRWDSFSGVLVWVGENGGDSWLKSGFLPFYCYTSDFGLIDQLVTRLSSEILLAKKKPVNFSHNANISAAQKDEKLGRILLTRTISSGHHFNAMSGQVNTSILLSRLQASNLVGKVFLEVERTPKDSRKTLQYQIFNSSASLAS